MAIDEPTSHEYAERSRTLQDLASHRWELTQTVSDVEPEGQVGSPSLPNVLN